MRRRGTAQARTRRSNRAPAGPRPGKNASKLSAGGASSPKKRHGRTSSAEPRSPDMDARMLAAIVQSSDAAIIGKTLDGIVTSWNRSAEKIFGYGAAEMIGRSIHVLPAPSHPKKLNHILPP